MDKKMTDKIKTHVLYFFVTILEEQCIHFSHKLVYFGLFMYVLVECDMFCGLFLTKQQLSRP